MPVTQTTLDEALPTISAIATDRGKQYLDGLKNGKDCEHLMEESEYLFGIADTFKYFDITAADADKCVTNAEVAIILDVALGYGTDGCLAYSQKS